MILARKGTDVYMKTAFTENSKTQEHAVFAEKTNDGKYASYLLFEDAKTALKSIRNDPPMDFSKEEELPNEMYSTTVRSAAKNITQKPIQMETVPNRPLALAIMACRNISFFSERMHL